jgi:hypothetical protein
MGLKKTLLLVVAAGLFTGVSQVQRSMNKERERLGITRVEPLKNAPPVLAFTTVALGGFRGLISNALWIRATDLQDEDKFFEMVQLADWITKLEPHYPQVWLVQAWNMAYNISVKFKSWPDRWRWVKRGFELLRDEGLAYNPDDTLIYRELGWIFQHKMGQNLDDAHMYYKEHWAQEMEDVLGKKPNLDEFINPRTADQTNRANILKEKYKLDPSFMKEVDREYGPLEWRAGEAHAVYWGAKGLKAAKDHPDKVKDEDLIQLWRLIYQSMQANMFHGKLVDNRWITNFQFGPNLDIVEKVSFAYEHAAAQDKKDSEHILKAHRNFLRDVVYLFFEQNRTNESAHWYKYLAQKYPDKPILDKRPDLRPKDMTYDQYAIEKVKEDAGELSPDRVRSLIMGMIANSYMALIQDDDDRSVGFMLLAKKTWQSFNAAIPESRAEPLKLADKFEDLVRVVRDDLLRVDEPRLAPEARAVLRSKLRLGPERKDEAKAESQASTQSEPQTPAATRP